MGRSHGCMPRLGLADLEYIPSRLYQRCYQDQGVRDQDQTKTRQAETETKTREAETKTKTKTKTSRVETKTKTSKKWS